MTSGSLIYLERDPFDGNLKPPQQIVADGFFQQGNLYALTSGNAPEEEYSVRCYLNERLLEDKIRAVPNETHFDTGRFYALEFSESELQVPVTIYFHLECTNEVINGRWVAWILRELNPAVLDALEEGLTYNMVGVTRLPE